LPSAKAVPHACQWRGGVGVRGRRHAPIVRRVLRTATDRRWHVPPCGGPRCAARRSISPGGSGRSGSAGRSRADLLLRKTCPAATAPRAEWPSGVVRAGAPRRGVGPPRHLHPGRAPVPAACRPPSATRRGHSTGADVLRPSERRAHRNRNNPSAEASCLKCPSLSFVASLRCGGLAGAGCSPPRQPRRVMSVRPIIAKLPSLRDPHRPFTFPEPDSRQISPTHQCWQGFVYGISLHGAPTIGPCVGRASKFLFINLPSTTLSDVGGAGG
jgi:hypothetical protein